MAFRTKDTYSVPGRGTTNVRKKTFTGKGSAPAGTKKIKPRPPRVVTTSPSGQITTSGFPSPRAAQAARKQSSSSQRRVRRIERQRASALGFHRRAKQRASEPLPGPSTVALRNRDAPMTTKTVVSSKPLGAASASRKASHATPSTFKPPKFQGAKTAGTPSLKELQVASSSGKLRTNRKGYVTTPAIRKTAGTLKRLESKARRSNGPLPGLTPQESQVARTVLRRGVKAGATRKGMLAAGETGLVESGFNNLGYGDADSEGWRQERTSIYGTGPTGPRNVKKSADRFFEEVRTDPGAATAPTAGMAAQAAQGSAYPERYDAVRPEANAILKAFEHGGLKPAQRRKLVQAQVKARKLGLKAAGTRKVRSAAKELGGPYGGSRAIVRQIVGSKIKGDKEYGHSTGGDHQPVAGGGSAVAYAQDINSPSGRPSEGEPPYTQGTLDKMVKNLRKLGADVPKLSIGENWEGTVKGYRIQLLTNEGGEISHIHIGARWSGGPTSGGAAGGYPSSGGGVTYSSGDVAAYASAMGQSPATVRKRLEKGRLTGYQILQKLKRLGAGVGAGLSEKPSEGPGSKASVLKELEARYGSKAA